MTLVLMAFDYHRKCRNLEMKDILEGGFRTGCEGSAKRHRLVQ